MAAIPPHLPVRASFVSSGPAQLYVRDVGGGLPIIVVHGGPDFNHDYLLPELDRLAEEFRLVYYDQRGRGRSFSGEPPGEVTMAGEIDDLDRVREWTGSNSVALLGHSWGALLALEYTVRHGDRLSHLILMNTAPASHADMLAFRQELAARRSPAETARMTILRSDPAYQRGDLDADAEFYRIHFRTTLRSRADLDRVVGRLRAAFTPEGIVAARAIEDDLYAQTWAQPDYDLNPQLRRLRTPTLVIHGEYDFIPIDIARHIAGAIPGARLLVVPDCGHFAYIERPEEVRSAIAEFLTATSSAERGVTV